MGKQLDLFAVEPPKKVINRMEYNLLYMINDRVIETITTNNTYKQCNFFKTQKIKTGNYKKEHLVIMNNFEVKNKNLVI